MASKAVTRFKVRVRELLPPSDPLVPSLLRLMAAVNDLAALQKLWVYAETRVGKTECEKEIIRAEHLCLFRFTCGIVYEAARTFTQFSRVLTGPRMTTTREKMPDYARIAFKELNRMFPKNFDEGTKRGKILEDLRNSVFHYAAPGEFRNALLEHEELGDIIDGEIVAASRYLLADDLQVQITMRSIGVDKKKFTELSNTITEAAHYLGHLADGILAVYLQENTTAIVEAREDRVDPERLWRLPSKAR